MATHRCSDTVPVRAITDVLRRPTRDVIVPEDQEVEFAPSNPETAVHFSQVFVKSIADLQLLGFVPRRLSEERVRQAVEEDDRAAYSLAAARLAARPASACECHGHAAAPSFSAEFRRDYRQVRQAHAPAVARVLSELFQRSIAFDDPHPRLVTRWVQLVSDKAFAERPILIAALMDITINRGATLRIEPLLKSLHANNVWIHRQGSFRQQGSHLRLWAHHISGFFGTTEIKNEVTARAAWILQGA